MPVDERFRYQHRRAGRLIIATANNPHGPKRRRHTHLARVDLCARAGRVIKSLSWRIGNKEAR